MDPGPQRRRLLAGSTLLLGAPAALAQRVPRGAESEIAAVPLSATETMMLEHGVLRRCLAIYAEAARRLRGGSGPVPLDALGDAVGVFVALGERVHESAIEEAIVFPEFGRLDEPSGTTAKVLAFQHARGREINAHLLAVTSRALSRADAFALAGTLDGYVRMYVHHAALEDTMVYPRWKAAQSPDALRSAAERFAAIEERMLGRDGFEDALRRVGRVEAAFGLAQLSQWSAPPPPRR